MPLKTILFPHFHYSSKPPETLSREAESAAIIGFSEAGRRKKSFLSGIDEQLKYVALLWYPVYAYPWRGMALLLKPLQSTGFAVNYHVTVNFHDFLGEVRRTSTDRGVYTKFLAENIGIFVKYPKAKRIDLGIFIPSGDLASVVVGEAKKQRVAESVVKGVLPFPMGEEEMEQSVAEFGELWSSIRVDLDNLSSVSEVLNRELERHTSKIELELSLVEERAEKEMGEVTPQIKKAVRKLEMERESSVRKVERSRRGEISEASRANRKLETELRRRRQQEARFKRERERRKSRSDRHGERFWGKELKRCRREISRLESSLRKGEEEVRKLRSLLAQEVEEIRESYAEKIRFEQRKIGEIEGRRDRDIRSLKEELAKLEEYTSKITRDIAKQAEGKKLEMERLEDMIVPWKIKDPIAIYIPFYLARYTFRSEARYSIIPPVEIDTDRSLSKVTRRLVGLEGKLTGMLRPFSKPLSNLLTGDISSLLSTNAAFAAKVDEEAANLNILSQERFSKMLEDGFKELVEKGVVSSNEASKIKSQKGHWGRDIAG